MEGSAMVPQADLWGAALKALAMLSIVVAILILILFLIKRFLYLNEGSSQGQLIKLLSSYHMAPKERIALIDVAGEKMVIGITPESITCLAKIEKPETLAQIESLQDHLAAGHGHFSRFLLSSLRSKRGASQRHGQVRNAK
jgi:flagellar protein FliO/FliZ